MLLSARILQELRAELWVCNLGMLGAGEQKRKEVVGSSPHKERSTFLYGIVPRAEAAKKEIFTCGSGSENVVRNVKMSEAGSGEREKELRCAVTRKANTFHRCRQCSCFNAMDRIRGGLCTQRCLVGIEGWKGRRRGRRGRSREGSVEMRDEASCRKLRHRA